MRLDAAITCREETRTMIIVAMTEIFVSTLSLKFGTLSTAGFKREEHFAVSERTLWLPRNTIDISLLAVYNTPVGM